MKNVKEFCFILGGSIQFRKYKKLSVAKKSLKLKGILGLLSNVMEELSLKL
jgi:hypothetical protein